MTKRQYQQTYEAKLIAQGYVCANHPEKAATTTGKTLCYACYSAKRWREDDDYRQAQIERHKEYVKNNRARINAIAKKWRDNNPEKHREAVKKSIAKRKQREAERGNNA